MRFCLIPIALLIGAGFANPAGSADYDWTPVDQAIGRKGTDQPGGIHKYSFPRSDLHITVDGTPIKPALGLSGWVAFQPMGAGAMFMGDLVLTDSEISPVIRRLIEDGIEISAIHNHLLHTSTPVFYMHVGGSGDAVGLAKSVNAALTLSQTPMNAAPPPPTPAAVDLDTGSIEKALGYKGKPKLAQGIRAALDQANVKHES